jgi:DNA-binding GntR family transcriptional regulator
VASLTIRLEIDPTTQKKNVIIKYDSDSDALPQEHEEQHKRLVDALIKNGTLKAEDLGHIHIEREGQGAAPKPSATPEAGEGQKVPQKG